MIELILKRLMSVLSKMSRRYKRLGKKGVSSVIITVLLIALVIIAITIVSIVIISFVKKGGGQTEGVLDQYTGKVGFAIESFTTEDLLSDRIRITNTGERTLTSFVIRIDGENKDIISQKNIKSRETKYVYLKNPFPAGQHTLSASSAGVSDEKNFNLGEDWHVSIENTEAS